MEVIIPANRPNISRPSQSTTQRKYTDHSAAAEPETVVRPAVQQLPRPHRVHAYPRVLESDPEGNQSLGVDPPLDSDMEGAELSKDARFWKVYVKETDWYDTELANGWNKSLDVILVQAALFSAVSTAFIIESSKKLVQDPSEISADRLSVIAQTLLVIASNNQVDNLPTLQGANNTTTFVPSRADVAVNTLWYTSLALSIATSFIAMLAKEWCHSFLASRTGHPFSQAQRRQKKWLMIERWKMQELLMVLPSLIHLALLLFAIGLCINVWQLNSTAAIPIICIVGLAMLFYLWSSIASSVVEFYPYTTMISHVLTAALPWISAFCNSVLVKTIFQIILIWLWPVGVIGVILDLIWWSSLTLVYNILAIPLRVCFSLFSGSSGSDSGSETDPGESNMSNKNNGVWLSLSWLPGLIKHPTITMISKLGELFTPGSKSSDNRNDQQDQITSLALQWLIVNCETPSSLAIALQAIAGASSKHPRQPLEDCNAALKILQRLVSSNSEGKLETLRYTRALTFLARERPSAQRHQASDSTGELEVMIWELQSANERNVSSLIIDGDFHPNNHNIDGLRLGSTAAVHSLKLLKGQGQLDQTILRQIVSTIQHQLHIAALVSLVNATAIISAAADSYPQSDAQTIARSCMRLVMVDGLRGSSRLRNESSKSPSILVKLPALLCLLGLGRPQKEPFPNRITRLRNVMRVLWERSTDTNVIDSNSFISAAVEEVLSKPGFYSLDVSYAKSHENQFPIIPMNRPSALEAIKSIYLISHVEDPALPNYLYIVHYMCEAQAGELRELSSLISRFCFPQLSRELIRQIAKYDLVSRLRNTTAPARSSIITILQPQDRTSEYFAMTQLWLLYALLGDSDPSEYTSKQRELSGLLEQNRGSRNHTHNDERQRLGTEILDYCRNILERSETLEIYFYRIAECIFQTGQHKHRYHDLQNRIDSEPRDAASTLRGLSSFAPRGAWKNINIIEPTRRPHVNIPIVLDPPRQNDPKSPSRASLLGLGFLIPNYNPLHE
ncbi:hypothetical protein B0J17DRAFT_620833 [Rhizoctonia solani]|nr:hypothetical protein B0J17DRAFT_620833 [Rhizoctonia solani]